MDLETLRYASRFDGVTGSAIREIFKSLADPTVISLAAGNPSAQSFPVDQLALLSRDIFENMSTQALQYSVTEGYTPLRDTIKARLKTYSVADFQTMFEKAEASDFLKGKNNRNWSANFDWMIKDANMTKILEGNYDNRSGAGQTKVNKVAEELDEFYDMATRWAEEE